MRRNASCSNGEYIARGNSSNDVAAEALASVKYGIGPVLTHPAMQDRFSGDNVDYTTAENDALRKTP